MTEPNVIEVKKENWEEYSFTPNCALTVQDGGENGYDFFINIDNTHLLNEIASKKNNAEIMKAKYKYSMVLIGMSLLNCDFDTQDESEEINIFDFVKKTTTAISPFLIPILELATDLDEDVP